MCGVMRRLPVTEHIFGSVLHEIDKISRDRRWIPKVPRKDPNNSAWTFVPETRCLLVQSPRVS